MSNTGPKITALLKLDFYNNKKLNQANNYLNFGWDTSFGCFLVMINLPLGT